MQLQKLHVLRLLHVVLAVAACLPREGMPHEAFASIEVDAAGGGCGGKAVAEGMEVEAVRLDADGLEEAIEVLSEAVAEAAAGVLRQLWEQAAFAGCNEGHEAHVDQCAVQWDGTDR